MTKVVHWTENSTTEFANRLSFDFITQLAKQMEALPLKQGEFAKKLGLSKGRISQIFNNPGNLTLNKTIEYARALGMKVAVVAYDDGDPNNERGPIHSEIFNSCWHQVGKPSDFWELSEMPDTASTFDAGLLEKKDGSFTYSAERSGNSNMFSFGRTTRNTTLNLAINLEQYKTTAEE